MNTYIGNYRYLKYSTLSLFNKKSYRKKVFLFIQKLSREYPRFHEWYRSLFVADNELAPEREIIICEKINKIVGIVILKRTTEEQKICTLRVAKEHQYQGIGKNLMEMSFEWLNNEKPLITVRKSKLIQFDSLFSYYGFELEQQKKHYYNFFGTELVYNGILPEKKVLINKIEYIDYFDLYQKYLKTSQEDFCDYLNNFFEQVYRKESLNKFVFP